MYGHMGNTIYIKKEGICRPIGMNIDVMQRLKPPTTPKG